MMKKGAGILSPRQMQVLKLLARSRSRKEIASRLGIKYSTVRFYVQQIYARLGVSCLLDALVQTRKHYPGFEVPAVLEDMAREAE